MVVWMSSRHCCEFYSNQKEFLCRPNQGTRWITCSTIVKLLHVLENWNDSFILNHKLDFSILCTWFLKKSQQFLSTLPVLSGEGNWSKMNNIEKQLIAIQICIRNCIQWDRQWHLVLEPFLITTLMLVRKKRALLQITWKLTKFTLLQCRGN